VRMRARLLLGDLSRGRPLPCDDES
jgi:hypothetical protein